MFQPLFTDSPRLTVREIIELWHTHTGRKQAAASLANRLQILHDFRNAFGEQLADSLHPLAVSTWIYSHESWKSDWTLYRVVGTLKAPLNWAVRVGVLGRNPLAMLTHPKGEPMRPLTEAEFLAFVRYTRPLFRRVLWFLALTGARPSEIAGLRWTDLDLARGAIVLTQHKTAKSQKAPRPRVIVLSDCACRLLIWIRKRNPLSEYVFLNSRRQPWTKNALDLRIRVLRKRIGLPDDAKLYGLRHRFGTKHCEKGTPLKILAELMGHTTTRMTEHYIHISGNVEHLKKYL